MSRRIEPVDGTDYFVRELTVGDYENAMTDKDGQPVNGVLGPANLLLHTLCNAAGEPVYTKDDAEAIRNIPFPQMGGAYSKALELNLLGNVEEAEKN